ncbi:hypothetical protein FJM67_04980 [Maribrevibacterium harenarium]|uniref:Uncharacterized protein n=1 Tax=Maribrevibacterium harenarium TaxID=2589817 RepID=A0A501WZL3_9GAMM|nr:hypothetical protein [Maribrevibacterium harenarium]TPE54302.1 hypothetical protein FJM67_04980 [Maribrevibacterium harenarium]
MEQFPQTRDDEIDLAELFAKLWRKRLVVVLVALLGFLAGGAVFLKSWMAQPLENQAAVELRFNFNGVQDGRYPNGQPFSINDIISTNVLNKVFEQKNLAQYGLTQQDFASAVSIAPFSTNREFIEARFKDALSAKNITPAEIAELNDNYSRELNASTRRFAKLSLSLPASVAISTSTQVDILGAIPQTWANEAVESYGVLNISNAKPNEFDSGLVEGYEYLISTRYLADYLDMLKGILKTLAADDVARLQVDPETGATVSTLENDLGDVKAFHLDVLTRAFSISPVAKDLNEAKFYLNNEILSKEEQLDETQRRAVVLQDAYNRYINGEQDLKMPGAASSASQNITAQYGDEFLTRLMSIGDQLSDAKFKQALLNRSLELRLEAENISTDISRLKRNLAQFDQAKNQTTSDIDEARVRKEISYVSEKLQSTKASIERIAALRADRILGQSSSLYALNSEPVVVNNFMAQVKALVKFAGLGLVAGLFIGLFAALMLAVVRK